MIYVERVTDIENFPLPVRGTPGSAGLDLSAAIGGTQTHAPGQTLIIPTGFAVQIPEGHVGFIRERSSVAKYGVVAVGGVIDSDYRGEVKMMLFNNSGRFRTIYGGERLAQLIILPIDTSDVQEVAKLDATARGKGGFGSTGMA